MDTRTPPAQAATEPAQATEAPKKPAAAPSRAPSIVVGVVAAAVAGLSIWYLVRPEPLLVQGEVDATRFDIAARVGGRVADVPVERGQNVSAAPVLQPTAQPQHPPKPSHARP